LIQFVKKDKCEDLHLHVNQFAIFYILMNNSGLNVRLCVYLLTRFSRINVALNIHIINYRANYRNVTH